MKTTADVVIVGAGIIGAACARALAKEGLSVIVVESRGVCAGASAAAEPNLRRGLAGGLLVSGDCVIFPPPAARWMLEQSGARLVIGEAVSIGDGGVLLRDRSRFEGRFVVNAAGIGAAALSAGIEVRARKGHLALTESRPGFLRHELVELGYLKSAHAI